MLLPLGRVQVPAAQQAQAPPALEMDVSGEALFRRVFRTPEEFVQECARNLTNRGLFLPTGHLRPLRDVVEFILVEPLHGREIRGSGEVIYTVDPGQAARRGGSPGLGLQILSIDESALAEARAAASAAVAEAALRPPDQRGAVRVPARLRVRYRTRQEFEEGVTRDISEGGAFLRTAEPYPVGTGVQLVLVRPVDGRELVVEGEVARTPLVTSEEGPSIGMGIRFHPLSPEQHQELHRFVRYLDIQRRARGAHEIRGQLADTGVEGVVHLLGETGRDGELVLRCGGESGRMEFRGSRVVRAEVPGRGLMGARAFLRMMTWEQGDFEYHHRPVDPSGNLDLPCGSLVQQGIQHRREVTDWSRRLPHDRRLSPGPRLAELAAELPRAVRSLLDALPSRPTVAAALDRIGETDAEAYRLLDALRARGVLQIE